MRDVARNIGFDSFIDDLSSTVSRQIRMCSFSLLHSGFQAVLKGWTSAEEFGPGEVLAHINASIPWHSVDFATVRVDAIT